MPAKKLSSAKWALSPDRCFDANVTQRKIARQIYGTVKDLPIVSPHGHVAPALLSDPNARFGSPADLFIIPDHYVFRMLYSQGINLTELGVPTREGPIEGADHRKIWQVFAENFYLFRGTPTGLWLADELTKVFGIDEKLDGRTAQAIYDHLESELAKPEFSPRALFKRFKIEVLCTTDAASDTLAEHKSLRAEGWTNVRPTFRPDAVINLEAENWLGNIEKLADVTGYDIDTYATFIQALQERRTYFKMMGATSTDQAALTPYTERLSDEKAEKIFGRALRGKLHDDDAVRFMAHMIIEMARMSAEDGLVMQLHAGSYRNHNTELFKVYGPDKGADIPVTIDWTRGLANLLNEFGNDSRLNLILFGLDESTYSRELAPLAGHYPAVRLGPPWWFHDSVNGMTRYLDQVMETAGLYNTTGFNDDTRAFASIPARHDVWRRVTSNWLAGLVVKGMVDQDEALEMAQDTSYRLAKKAYHLD
jgi:glucuronate isomerase